VPGTRSDCVADPAARRKRIKAGGNKKEKFTEGWIEFCDKKDAKFVAATLNNTAMGELE